MAFGVMLTWSATAAANDTPTPAGDFDVIREARQVAYINTAPAGDRVYSEGERILDAPLMWEAGVRLTAPLAIVADTDTISLNAGDILPAVLLGKAGSSVRTQAFCTQRKPGERKADSGVLGVLLGGGSLWRSMLRAASDKQFCLLDVNDDGIAEQSVMIHAGTPAARTPVSIPPVPLDRQVKLPVSGENALRITLNHVAKSGSSASFYLDIVQQGQSRTFTSFGSTSRVTSVSLKKATEAHIVEMVDTRFEIVSVNGPARQATIRWPQDRDANAFVPIPDGLRIVTRYY